MGEYLEIDVQSLSIREIEEVEDIIGFPFDQAFAADRPKAKTLRALAYITKKRDDPSFTLDDAGDLIVRVPDPDPTSAAD